MTSSIKERPAYQQRAIEELYELNERISKLRAHLSTPIFQAQSAYDQSLMVVQLQGMIQYQQALQLRVDRFDVNH